MFLEAVGVWDFVPPFGKGVCVCVYLSISCSRFRSGSAAGFSHPALVNPFGMSVFNYILSSAECILFNLSLAQAEHKGLGGAFEQPPVPRGCSELRFPNQLINSKAGDLCAGPAQPEVHKNGTVTTCFQTGEIPF